MKATSPAGETYRINRRWWPWRWKQRVSDGPWDLDVIGGALDGADDLASGLLLLVLGVVACFVLPILFLFLVTGIEWVLLLVVLPVAVTARMLFGEHWMVSVKNAGSVQEFDGGSWRESAALIQQIAAQIASGDVPAGFDQTPIEA